MTSVLKEIYSKCLAKENDISKEIAKIMKNTYPIDTIERVRQKVKESILNYEDSINLLNISIETADISKEEKEIWKRKSDYFESSSKNLNKSLDESINKVIRKKNKHNFKFNYNEDNSIEMGKNINNLEQEQQSWKSLLKLTSEIESTAINVNKELDNQLLSLSNISGKITNIFQTITGSYRDSTWINQRGKNDKYICLFLGFLTVIIIGFTYYFLRPKIRG